MHRAVHLQWVHLIACKSFLNKVNWTKGESSVKTSRLGIELRSMIYIKRILKVLKLWRNHSSRWMPKAGPWKVPISDWRRQREKEHSKRKRIKVSGTKGEESIRKGKVHGTGCLYRQVHSPWLNEWPNQGIQIEAKVHRAPMEDKSSRTDFGKWSVFQ